MPIFNQSLPQQETSTSAGISTYPNLKEGVIGTVIVEQFNRNTLNPSGAVAFYSTGGVGTPSVTLASNRQLNLTTSATLNDNVFCVGTNLGFSRQAFSVDSRSTLEFKVVFGPGSTATLNGFLGLTASVTGLTALPTTARHFGLYWNTAVDTHMWLTSGDGSAQSKTDTGIAINTTNFYLLDIIWNGVDSATITLYDLGTTGTSMTKKSTQTVTSFLGSTSLDSVIVPHFFGQTLASAAEVIMSVFEWSCAYT